MPTIVPFETLNDLFVNLTKKYDGTTKTAFARKPGSGQEYESILWDEVTYDARSMAAWLIEFGIEAGDTVALLSENRYEWAVVDLALQLIGGVNVSLYSTLPPNQCEFILQNAGAALFFVSTGIQLKKGIKVFDQCPELKSVVAFERPKVERYMKNAFVSLFDDKLAKGRKLLAKHEKEIHARSKNISPDDLATLVYTSGTTGKPKGAMLTHHNIVSNVKAAHAHIHISDEDRCLSFLPLCHSFERTCGYYAMMAGGAEIYYAESVDTVAKNMTEAHPTIIISVPRLFEKMYNIIAKNLEEGSAIKQVIFDWAINVGRKYADGKRGLVSLQKAIADKLVFDKLKERTGGNVRMFVSGGAALPPKIGSFFIAAGLNILEGYGLTETSPIMCANQYGEERIGTVGTVLQGVTVGIQRLDDSTIISGVSGEDYPTDETSEAGEILCKGPNVMKGYWNDEQATREIIDDAGWLHTGDMGRFTDGYLQITDRIKHMIVNAGGKNIYPGPIEDLFKTSKWIDQLVVVGENQAYMAALIVPDFEVLEAWAHKQNISYSNMEKLLEYEEVKQLYKKEIRSYSQELASHEKIRDFRLLPEEFTVETGELTPTLKVKRRIIRDKYGHIIDDMFSG